MQKTVWEGRFTCLRKNPVFIIDGAHNEDAAIKLRTSIERYFKGKEIQLIMGVFQDKEYEKDYKYPLPAGKEGLHCRTSEQSQKLKCRETLRTVPENIAKKQKQKTVFSRRWNQRQHCAVPE